METVICETEEDYPDWLRGHARDVADQYINEHEVIVARRSDGNVQIAHDGYLDAEVIANLLKWAAGVQ